MAGIEKQTAPQPEKRSCCQGRNEAVREPAKRFTRVQRALGNQGSLRLGRAGDAYEREADRVADALMNRSAAPGLATSHAGAPSVQRMCKECEEEEERGAAQRKEADGRAPETPAGLRERLDARRGAGESLPESERAFFEPRFGRDFGDVRVHRDDEAAGMARDLNARAFTTGRDIYFAQGEYAPGTGAGRWLMAHELTHVVQQAAGSTGVSLAPEGSAETDVNDARAVEHELGEGRSLDSGVREKMEGAFGMNFSHVRLHTDATSAALAAKVDARAFAVGRHIAFGAGEYRPGTPAGDALIAHELAHTVQQRGANAVEPSGSADASLDKDATRAATGAMMNAWARARGWAGAFADASMPSLRSGLRLQRCNGHGNKTPDGVGLGPTDTSKMFCLKAGSFTVTHSVNANTATAASGRQDMRFEGENTGAQDGKTCSCDCGLYRQFIRGYYKIDGGDKQYQIGSCAPNTVTMSETDWAEEYTSCIGDNDADACKFAYADGPGFSSLGASTAVDLHYDFLYQVWDKCQGRAVDTKNKTLTITGNSAPRSITWS